MTEIFIQGFLGRDAVVRKTEGGSEFLAFTMCSNEFINGKQKEQWFNCLWFDYNAKIAEYLKKGKCVNVFGTFDDDIETSEGKVFIRRNVNVHHLVFSTNTKTEGVNQKSNTNENTQASVAENISVGVTKKTTKATPTPPSDEEISVGMNNKQSFSAEADDNSDLPF